MENQTGAQPESKPKIHTLPDAGFCYGVRKAVSKALATARDYDEEAVYTLGEIVHNPLVVNDLQQEGITVAETPEKISSGSVVIIRSHGVPPQVIIDFKKRGVSVVDATCPKVRRVQRAAEKFRNEHWPVTIVGRQDHPEVRGVLARCDDEAEIVDSQSAAQQLSHRQQRAVLFQTTFPPDLVEDILGVLQQKTGQIQVEDTLCHVVSGRRQAVRDMAEKVEALVVVGGKNSSNTSALVGVGTEAGIPSYHVETADDLPVSHLGKFGEVAVVGGTSTPQSSINSVKDRLLSILDSRTWSN